MTADLAHQRYLAARQVVDDMIAGRRPSRMPPDELRRRAIALRSSAEYVARIRESQAESGLGFWPLILVAAGGLVAWKGFSWAEEREKRLACEANPESCGIMGQMLPLLLLLGLGAGAYYYVQTGRVPFLTSLTGGG